MIPAAFDYEAAESVDQALALLGSADDPKLLAGGPSLLPRFRLRLARPATLIDLGGISSARGTEMYLALWLRLWGALGTGYFNIAVQAA